MPTRRLPSQQRTLFVRGRLHKTHGYVEFKQDGESVSLPGVRKLLEELFDARVTRDERRRYRFDVHYSTEPESRTRLLADFAELVMEHVAEKGYKPTSNVVIGPKGFDAKTKRRLANAQRRLF